MEGQSTASLRLRALIKQLLAHELDAPTFCARFERTYNLDTNKAELAERERQAFELVFNEVVYFSPFPDERAAIPNYRGENEVLNAAREAEARLA